jgi:hypothetical protein
MRALTSLSLSSNKLKAEGVKIVADAIKVSMLLRLFWYQFHTHLTNGSTAVVCHCPQDMGALTSLNVSDNSLGGIVLVDGITHCKDKSGKMKYWDKDDKCLGEEAPPGCGPLGIIALANAIPDMGAMSKLTFGDEQPVITLTTEMTEANFSGKLKFYEAQIVAAFLPKCM